MGPLVMKVLLEVMDYGDGADEGMRTNGWAWVVETMANISLKLLDALGSAFW